MTKVKNLNRYVLGTALILLVPLTAMMFTDEVQWDFADFVVIGGLLIGAGLMFELVSSKVNAKYRGIIAVMIVAAVILIWVELAVGIFD